MLDEKDKKILNIMVQNPDTSQKQISEELGITPPAVYGRIQRMKEQGIFLGSAPIINLKKIGYDLTTIINIKVKNGKTKEALAKWAQDPNVCSAYDITGEYDLLFITKFHNTEELDQWNKKILKDTEHIERVNTSLAFSVQKEATNPNRIE